MVRSPPKKEIRPGVRVPWGRFYNVRNSGFSADNKVTTSRAGGGKARDGGPSAHLRGGSRRLSRPTRPTRRAGGCTHRLRPAAPGRGRTLSGERGAGSSPRRGSGYCAKVPTVVWTRDCLGRAYSGACVGGGARLCEWAGLLRQSGREALGARRRGAGSRAGRGPGRGPPLVGRVGGSHGCPPGPQGTKVGDKKRAWKKGGQRLRMSGRWRRNAAPLERLLSNEDRGL